MLLVMTTIFTQLLSIIVMLATNYAVNLYWNVQKLANGVEKLQAVNISIAVQFNQYHTDHSNIFRIRHSLDRKYFIAALFRIDYKALKSGVVWTALPGAMKRQGAKRFDARNQSLHHTVSSLSLATIACTVELLFAHRRIIRKRMFKRTSKWFWK